MAAKPYNRTNERSLWNNYYKRPVLLALLVEVKKKAVLDVGCGAPVHAAALVERGARITGIDASGGLLAVAARRVGDAAELRVGDVRQPPPFSDAVLDVVLARWSCTISKVGYRHGGSRDSAKLVRPSRAEWEPAVGASADVAAGGGHVAGSGETAQANGEIA